MWISKCSWTGVVLVSISAWNFLKSTWVELSKETWTEGTAGGGLSRIGVQETVKLFAFCAPEVCSAHACFHQAEKFFDTTPAFFFPVSSHFSWFQSQFWLVQLRSFPLTGGLPFPHRFRLCSTGYAVKGRESTSGTQAIYQLEHGWQCRGYSVHPSRFQSETCLQNIPNWRCYIE